MRLTDLASFSGAIGHSVGTKMYTAWYMHACGTLQVLLSVYTKIQVAGQERRCICLIVYI